MSNKDVIKETFFFSLLFILLYPFLISGFLFCYWLRLINKRNFKYKTSFNPIRLHLKENQKLNKKNTDSHSSSKQKWIWIHVSSLGEYKTIQPLLKEIGKRKKILLTYFNEDMDNYLIGLTPKEKSVMDSFFFLPFENPIAYNRILSHYDIDEYWSVEGDLWPVLFAILKANKKIKMKLWNAPFFDKEWKLYQLFQFIYRPMYRCFDCIYPTSKLFYDRFLKFGIEEAKLKIISNLKYYKVSASITNSVRNSITNVDSYKKTLKKKDTPLHSTPPKISLKKTILISSIHQQEIDILLSPLSDYTLQKNYNLIIAPRYLSELRHFEHFLKKKKLRYQTITSANLSLSIKAMPKKNKPSIHLVSGYGFLEKLYPLSEIVIVGGTFYPLGGHNPLEPLAFEKRILMGIYFEHFADIVEDVKEFVHILNINKKNSLKERVLVIENSIKELQHSFSKKSATKVIKDIVKKQSLQELLKS